MKIISVLSMIILMSQMFLLRPLHAEDPSITYETFAKMSGIPLFPLSCYFSDVYIIKAKMIDVIKGEEFDKQTWKITFNYRHKDPSNRITTRFIISIKELSDGSFRYKPPLFYSVSPWSGDGSWRMYGNGNSKKSNCRIENVLETMNREQKTHSSTQASGSSFTHTRGYSAFLNYANKLKGISYIQEARKFIPYCQKYANLAVSQARRRLNENCSSRIPLYNNDVASQWSLEKRPQEAWCKTVSAYATSKETKSRENKLKKCISSSK